MALKLKTIFDKAQQKPVAFIVKGSPDPDAIAGSLALLAYYEAQGGSGKVYYDSYISHSNNKTMINILGIQLEKIAHFSDLNAKYEYYIVVDHASPTVEGLDMTKCLLHIDHHSQEGKDKEKEAKCFAQIIEHDAGASASIVTRLLNEAEFFQSGDNNLERLCTALMYGIRTDTDNLDSAGPKDWEAMKVLAQHASKADIKKIAKSRITAQTAEILKKALATEQEEQGWLYAGVGFLQESYRDSIATVADELMRRSGIEHVLVYAIIEKADQLVVEGSVRSIDPGMDLHSFVKSFSENAGGRKHKGGFQIPLGFWGSCPKKETLQDFVKATIEAKLLSILSTATKAK